MTTKLSQIALAPANPALTDYLVGVSAAGTDYRYTPLQLGVALSPTPPNTQTGSSYTLGLLDLGGVLEMNNASANTVTIPPNASTAFPVGAQVDVIQLGVGRTTILAGSGVTILTFPALALMTPGQYAMVALYQRAVDIWVINGASVS